MVSLSFAGSAFVTSTAAVRPVTVAGSGAAGDQDRVGAEGAVDHDRVGGAVAATRGAGEVGAHLGHARPAEVVDDDVVEAAEGAEVDDLDVVGCPSRCSRRYA